MRLFRAAATLALTAAATATALAAQASAATITAIRADRLIVGDGTQIVSPVVLVQGERITAVGTAAQVTIPRGATVIDLRGHTLLPGFIDAHTHLTSIDNDGGDLAALRETPAHGAIYATVNAEKTLRAGFTTVREAGSLGYVDVAVRDAITRGLIPGPRIHASGPALGTTGGHADVNGWSPFLQLPGTGAIVDGVDQVRHQVRLNVKFGADQIKIVATGGVLSVGDAIGAPQMTQDELTAAVTEAARLGRKVMAHAHAGEGLLAAVRAGVASIEHGSLVSDEAIAEMKRRGTYLVPTLIILEEIVHGGAAKGVPPYAVAKATAIAAERRVRLRAAYQAGVLFALGTDATSDIHGRNGEEFKYMVDILGATPMEAITIGTLNGARLLGVDRDLGTVTTGKLADLVAVAGLLRAAACLTTLVLAPGLRAQTTSADWPVYGGSDDHTHYTRLDQISPANVRQLQVAWTFATGDEFAGSEMQANPVVIDGTLYATTPKLQVFALDAATGRQLWRFDPNNGRPPTSRFRHRGVVVTGDRVIFNYRNRLYALDRRTGVPIKSFGDSGWIDLRAGLGRPVEGLSVSASTPGVVFEDLFIIGSSVPEALPSAPGDIRAYDVRTGALRWSFHTIPHPGEFGYETWPADAWQIAGGANAWSGVTLDATRGMVFAATGSASFDFYGANRLGDNLFANTVLALDARTGKRIWHFQGLHHDLWDRDFPAAPALVTVTRDGKPVDAVAQITKTGHVYLFERTRGTPLFPIEERPMPAAILPGERSSATQPFPILPPPFARQSLTEADLTQRTPEAHAAALNTFREFSTEHPFSTPDLKGTIIFPGVDGGGEWGGPAFDPATGLLYVNSNEMAWLLKLVPRSDRSLFAANCASCHGDDRKGTAGGPSLIDVISRRSRDEILKVIREGTGRMPAFGAAIDGGAINDIVNYLVTGRDASVGTVGTSPYALPYRTAFFDIFVDHEGYPGIKPPWGTLNAIDLNAGSIRWSVPFGEYPKLTAQGVTGTGTDNYGGAIVTENGLLIIAATTYDNRIRAFDKRNGALLWEAQLPAAGNATPSTYMVNGRQYLVIACGGGKNGAPSGGTYVAFALPRSSR